MTGGEAVPEIVLHHYPRSPFAEKARLAMGAKGIAYRSVTIPAWMPKPDLVALTGGYRRTPVMQVGADIYCDTAMILRQLERMHPAPTLFPEGVPTEPVAWWAEKAMFFPAIGLARCLAETETPAELLEDRRQFLGFPIDRAAMLPLQPTFQQALGSHLEWLRRMLEGRDFLLGPLSSADLAAYHPIWYLRKNLRETADRVLPGLVELRAWCDRVEALGHGRPRDLPSQDALAMAAAAEPAPLVPGEAVDLPGCRLGDQVVVRADDHGRDPVHGTLVQASATKIVLRRAEPAIGEINVHFPRAGFEVSSSSARAAGD